LPSAVALAFHSISTAVLFSYKSNSFAAVPPIIILEQFMVNHKEK
jgi:hypothetical protein